MPARLILNADDFGLTRGINRAILDLHSASVLTSATLMANGAAFDDAVEIAHAQPTLGVGCHIVLVDGIPLSPPRSVPSLIGADGKSFRSTLGEFVRAILLGCIDEEDVAREARAHIDSHKHMHLFPSIVRTLLRVAEGCGVGAVRNPFEPPWAFALGHGSGSRRLAIRLLGGFRSRFESTLQSYEGRIRSTDGTVGISTTGELSVTTLAEILRVLPAHGTYELCCHPGYNDGDLDRVATSLRAHRSTEREALLGEVAKAMVGASSPLLVHYGSLADEEKSPL